MPAPPDGMNERQQLDAVKIGGRWSGAFGEAVQLRLGARSPDAGERTTEKGLVVAGSQRMDLKHHGAHGRNLDGRAGDHYDPVVSEFRVLFTAADYDNTVAFFTDTMGLPMLRSWDDHGRGTIISAAGEGQIEVFDGDPSGANMDGAVLAWQVDDVDERCARLEAAGVDIASPPTDQSWGHRNATFSGPEGLTITLFTVTGDPS